METLSRREVVRLNASYRMKGLNHLIMPLPPKPEPIYGWELYSKNGTYMGFTKNEIEMKEFLVNHTNDYAKKAVSIRG